MKAPYNFVPLSGAVYEPDWAGAVSQDAPFEDGLSGEIRFSIHAETPLIVGDERKPASPQAAGVVQMFTLPDGKRTPAIPGSSLRGMVRNVLEIASFAKFAMVDDARFQIRDLHDRAGYQKRFTTISPTPVMADDQRFADAYEPKSRAGLLRFSGGQWRIHPMVMARIEHNDLVSHAQTKLATLTRDGQNWRTTRGKYETWRSLGQPRVMPFSVESTPQWHAHNGKALKYAKAKIAPTGLSGLIVFTGQPSGGKHLEFVFFRPAGQQQAGGPPKPPPPIEVPEEVRSRFLAMQKALLDRDDDAGDTTWGWLRERYLTGWDTGLPGSAPAREFDGIPVFWLPRRDEADRVVLENGSPVVAEMGVSMMFPLPARHSVHELRAAAGKRHGDGGRAAFDLAELIFGRAPPAAKPGASEPSADLALRGRASFGLALPQEGSRPTMSLRAPIIASSPKASFYPAYLRQTDGAAAFDPKRPHRTWASEAPVLSGWKRYPVRAEAIEPSDATIHEGLHAKKQIQTRYEPIEPPAVFETVLRFHNLRPAELGAVVWAMTFGGDEACRHSLGGGKPYGFGRVRLEIDDASWADGIVTNAPGAPVPDRQACIEAYLSEMRAFGQKQRLTGGWDRCEQIRSLRGMAALPSADAVPGPDSPYMALDEHGQAKGGRDPRTRQPAPRQALGRPRQR